MRIRHPLLSGGIIALAATVLAACGGGGAEPAAAPAPQGDTTVNVAYVPASLFAPLYVAMSKGYFTQRHLDVHLTTVQAGQDAVSLAATGKVQAVLAGFSAGLFNAINAGQDVKVVGSMAHEPSGQAADGLVLASQLADTVKTPADLKGRKIGVSGGPGATGGYLLAEALAPYHLTLTDVMPVNLALPDQAAALKSGGVAAALMSSPFLSDAVSSGTGKLIASAQPGTSTTGVIYSGAFAKSPAAQPFFDALAQGAQDLQGDQAKATPNLEIVAKAIGQKLNVLQEQPADTFDPQLAPSPQTLDSMQQVFQQAGLLNYSTLLPSSKFVDDTFSSHVPKA